MKQLLTLILILCLMPLLTSCQQIGKGAVPSKGGEIRTTTSSEGVMDVWVHQPSNPEQTAWIEVTDIKGNTIKAGTGSSRKNTFAGLAMRFSQYKIFVYIGSGICALGIALTVASIWVPLIPKMAGPLVFIGGGLTAYLSTAIPEYGPYALVLSVVGLVIWYYYQNAAKKDPRLFNKNAPTTGQEKLKLSTKNV